MQPVRICPNCHTPNRPQARFCAQCGQPIGAAPTAPAVVSCPHCRAPNRPGARHCAHCGGLLVDAARPPARKSSLGGYACLVVALLALTGLCCGGVIAAGALGIFLGGRYAVVAQAQQPSATFPATSTRQPPRPSPTLAQNLMPSPTPSLTFTPLPSASATPLPTATHVPTATPTLAEPPGPFAPQVGAYAPDFTLRDAMTDELVSLSQFYGRPVMINFWATWCKWCVQEMPAIQAAYERHQAEGLVILAVNVGESQREARDFALSKGLTFHILLDSDMSIDSLYNLEGYPTSVFVKPDGMIAYIQLGSMEAEELAVYLSLILP